MTCLTFPYKRVEDTLIHLDLYPPNVTSPLTPTVVPVVVYFHGGGLTVGNSRSWFPHWLQSQ